MADADAWLWVVDALAAELAELPVPTRSALVAKLVSKAGYAVADCEYDQDGRARNARIQLVTAIAARMSD